MNRVSGRREYRGRGKDFDSSGVDGYVCLLKTSRGLRRRRVG